VSAWASGRDTFRLPASLGRGASTCRAGGTGRPPATEASSPSPRCHDRGRLPAPGVVLIPAAGVYQAHRPRLGRDTGLGGRQAAGRGAATRSCPSRQHGSASRVRDPGIPIDHGPGVGGPVHGRLRGCHGRHGQHRSRSSSKRAHAPGIGKRLSGLGQPGRTDLAAHAACGAPRARAFGQRIRCGRALSRDVGGGGRSFRPTRLVQLDREVRRRPTGAGCGSAATGGRVAGARRGRGRSERVLAHVGREHVSRACLPRYGESGSRSERDTRLPGTEGPRRSLTL
jgi:hypothetical protein